MNFENNNKRSFDNQSRSHKNNESGVIWDDFDNFNKKSQNVTRKEGDF